MSPPPMRTCVARASLTRARTTVSPASVSRDHIPGRPYPGAPALLAPVLRGHPPALPAPVRGCCLAAWSCYNFLRTCVCNRICFSLSETVSVIKRSGARIRGPDTGPGGASGARIRGPEEPDLRGPDTGSGGASGARIQTDQHRGARIRGPDTCTHATAAPYKPAYTPEPPAYIYIYIHDACTSILYTYAHYCVPMNLSTDHSRHICGVCI